MTKRLVVFGCSFTNYGWPTWADILAMDNPDWEFENWALPGIGNQGIARRVMYRHYSQGWQPNEIVVVQWTSMVREDRFKDGEWLANGSVFNSKHYGIEWCEKYWDFDNDIINTVQSQKTVSCLVGDKLAYQMRLDDPISNYIKHQGTSEIYEFWKNHLGTFDSPEHGPFLQGLTTDRHPDPVYWMNYVEEKIYKPWGMSLKPSTVGKIFEYQNWLLDLAKEKLQHDEISRRSSARMLENGWALNLVPTNGSHPYTGKKILM